MRRALQIILFLLVVLSPGAALRALILNGVRLPDAESVASTYDALGRVYSEVGNSAIGPLYAYGYLYDAVGNLRQLAEYGVGLPARIVNLGYDNAYRLTSEAVTDWTGKPVSSTTYGYDSASNRSTKAAGGVSTTYMYNSLNQMSGFSDSTGRHVGFTYDANGNRTTRTQGTATDTYGYDGENRLVSLTKGGVNYGYTYDYRARRVSRTEGSVSTQSFPQA